MAPSILVTLAATPALPLPPTPAGQFTVLPAPTTPLNGAETCAKKSVKTAVVPDESERYTKVIAVSGSFTPGLTEAIAESFHLVILARKISDSTSLFSFSWPGATPLTLTTGTTPPIMAGNWARPLFSRSAAGTGSSLAPKSTVLA